jgi:iron complex outermembrane receptor protein
MATAAIFSLTRTTHAQTVPEPLPDDRVILSPFEVASTRSKGYTSSNAATGFKTNQVLLQIPQAVTLVTRDLIEDIGAVDSSEVLQFAGVTPFYKGESYAIRGARILFAMIDDVPDQLPYADNAYVDSYTVLRGPASTLYLNASIGGTVLITTKKPQFTPQYSFTAKTDSHGLMRGEIDLTGPLGNLGAAKFAYRFVGVAQGGDTFLKNQKDDRISVHPSFEMVYKHTVVRVAMDHHEMDHAANANSFITPTGKLYTGAGRSEGYFVKGTMENHKMTRYRFELLQKFSEIWDMKITAQDWDYWRLGTNVFPSGGIQWPAQTMRLTARANDRGDHFTTVLADVNGKYTLFNLPMETAFGAAYSKQWGESWIRATSTFGTKTVSISNPQLDLLTAPRIGNPRGDNDAGDYPVVTPGNGSATYRGNGYFQQTVEILPKRLTAIAGITYSKIKTNAVNNLFTNAKGNVTFGKEYLHRYGLVYNITSDFTAYAMEATMFNPQFSKDINGNLLDNQKGRGREVGLKTAFLGGRISSTLSFFNIQLSNQAFFAGTLPNGTSYFAPLGTTTQKGFDLDMAVEPFPGLQFVAAYYNGTVKDQTGALVPNTFQHSASIFGRYEFKKGALGGLSIGGGWSRTSGRIISSAGITTGLTPNPATLTLQPGNMVNVFANYHFTKHFGVRASIENVLDEAFATGAQAAYLVDPSTPRTFTFSAIYRY